MTEPTPADLRALVAEAEQLAGRAKVLANRLRSGGDPEQHVAFAVENGVDGVNEFVREMIGAVNLLVRVRVGRGSGICSADWGVCPEHGATLGGPADQSTCTVCGRSWNYDRAGSPCGEPVAAVLTGKSGPDAEVCRGHAVQAAAQVEGCVVEWLAADGER